jgi:hypothetical protein
LGALVHVGDRWFVHTDRVAEVERELEVIAVADRQRREATQVLRRASA